MKVEENLKSIQEKIDEACKRSGRNPGEVTIIAVTKYVSTERAKEAVSAGIANLGENRDEGMLAKHKEIGHAAKWHFIGSLQTRKVKNIIGIADYIHSLDRLSLAKEIDKRAEETVQCLIQVNASGEESKQGLSPEEVIPFVKDLEAYPYISAAGLMTMAPLTDDEEVLRHCFRTLKTLQKNIQDLNLAHAPCRELSMGMSNDFGIAVEEGATMVRIGTALVGE
ncbi:MULTISPECIES: YggS family pyridoxal phosphate-dependent enzyme [Bacillus]|uniref:Pyridoxal phosphate homeostasis protein n=1 Tax=Bacillus infantis TaxID=324767 RepID=A0A5D4SIG1_9BACI|nr:MULTISPECIES: YggS family pyridoxal phosphate-dependent enzyme [Bacillus]MCK6203876.1 YggS family pyridoxal phosphate-dependent enzyme [Bacillus infantis]PLR71415.1 YggS family pyridoxal phosphate-dependent enzyme [Bacillus sp. UMB0728]TYS63079.1 YggS family pyridoxal phosphate-dependent enzyme [Bacillus infantis]